MKRQYCQFHKIVEDYPACETEYSNSVRHSRNTQLPEGERPYVFENPQTGEVRYLHTDYMAKHYEGQGFQRKEFTSYQEHKKWCDARGMVNHAVEGIKDEALKS